jgi:Ni,Fe-hydrogenase III large subunit
MARLRVRFEETAQAFRLIRQAAEKFPERPRLTPHTPCEPPDGRAVGCAQAPPGEVVYDVAVEGGRIARCQPLRTSRRAGMWTPGPTAARNGGSPAPGQSA